MEDGGKSLLDFVMRAYKMMEANKLEIDQWLKMCKLLFKQMIEAIEFIHSKQVSHFDISLENFLVNDIDIKLIQNEYDKSDEKIVFCFDKEGSRIQCKLCDFGLAEYFPNGQFMSTKYCGLLLYLFIKTIKP